MLPEAGRFPISLSARRFVRLIGWDGLFPLFVVSRPVLVKAIFPKGHIVEVVAAVLVPTVVSLVRASIGHRQITRICRGRAPLIRQAALAAAIIHLFLFEALAGMLTFADDEPAFAWCFPVAFYAIYLVMITLALRAAPEESLSPAQRIHP